MNELKKLVSAAVSLHDSGEPYLSATVVQVFGSAYRKPGARMLATQERWIAGSISAGCLERDILSRGLWRVREGQPVLVRFDGNEDALDEWEGSGCQGVIDVLLEPGASHAYDAYAFASRCLETETAGVIATVFASERADVPVGAKLMATPDDVHGSLQEPGLRTWLIAAARELIAREGGADVVTHEPNGEVKALLEPVVVPPHLFVFGSGHDVGPLVSMAQGLGWSVSLWDGQTRVSTRERLQGVGAYLTGSAQAAVQRLNACVRPVAVVMTHELRRDEEVLSALLPSRARYIGMLGPRRRTERLLSRCLEPAPGEGTAAELRGRVGKPELRGRLFGPAGLATGGETPAEIALSIVAQAQAVLSGASAREVSLPQVFSGSGSGSGSREL